MSEELTLKIKVINATKMGFKAAASDLKRFKNSAQGAFRGLSKGFGMLRNAFRKLTMVAGAALAGLAYTIKKSFDFETLEVQFEVLLGSVEKAKDRMKDLAEFSARTPFQIQDIAAASKQLEVLTRGAMGTAESMKLMGDAAAVMDVPLQELALHIGRVYAGLKSGAPVGRATRRMMQMGVITNDTKQKLDKFALSAKNFDKGWIVLTKDMERYRGGMVKMSKTGNGLMSTLRDNWVLAIKDFGDQFKILAKDDIAKLIVKIQELRKSGKIKEWAMETLEWVKKIQNAIKPLTKMIAALFEGGEQRKIALQGFADMGSIIGETALEILLAGAEEVGALIVKGMVNIPHMIGKYLGERSAALSELAAEGKVGAIENIRGQWSSSYTSKQTDRLIEQQMKEQKRLNRQLNGMFSKGKDIFGTIDKTGKALEALPKDSIPTNPALKIAQKNLEANTATANGLEAQ